MSNVEYNQTGFADANQRWAQEQALNKAKPQDISDIEKLRSAGFGADEIGNWATSRRQELTQAGFSSSQIDNYITGLDVPTQPPKPFLDRFATSFNKIVGAAGKGVAQGWGDQSLGIDSKTEDELRKLGVWADPTTGRGGPLRFANEAVMRPAAAGLDAVMRSISAGIWGAAGAAGQTAEETGAVPPRQGEKVASDLADFANIGMMVAGSTPETYFMVRPGGDVKLAKGLPQAQDFMDSATAIAGKDVPPNVSQKLLTLYKENGIHPAEVVHDAATDVTIKQDLLSADNLVPEAYVKKNLPAVVAGEKGMVEPPGGTAISKTEEPAGGGGGKPPAPPEEPVTAAGEPPKAIENKAFPGSYQDAENAILDQISIGEQPIKKGVSLKDLYTATVDHLYPIAKYPDAYQAYRLLSGTGGKIDHFLQYGTYDFGTYKNTGEALFPIVQSIDDLDGFRAFAASARALELENRGIKSGFDANAAYKVVNEGRGKYGETWGRLIQYQDSVAKYLRDSGVLSDNAYDAMKAANRAYVPFNRVVGEEFYGTGKGYQPINPIKRISGSERRIVDPLESVIRNTYMMVTMAERNSAAEALVSALEGAGEKAAATRLPAVVPTAESGALGEAIRTFAREEGAGAIPDELTDVLRNVAEGDKPGQISVYRGGKRETYLVDDDIANAIRGLDMPSTNWIIRSLGYATRGLRAGYVLTPDFWARHLFRENFYSLLTYTGDGGVYHPLNLVRGLAGMINKDELFRDWLKGGGAHNSLIHLDRNYLQEDLQKLSEETGLFSRGWNTLTHPIQTLRMGTEVVLSASHHGAYRKQIEALQKGEYTKEDIQHAAWISRHASVDNTRIGSQMRAYNMISAFFNATIQDPFRIVQAFRENPMKTGALMLGGISLPSALLWWHNKDDPRYQDLPQWRKDLAWNFVFPDFIFSLPKPFATGVVFGSGTERLLDAFYKENPHAFDDFGTNIVQQSVPSLVPTGVAPVLEQWANNSFFNNQPLIPQALEGQLPEYQYNQYTTETAKALGRIVGAFPGMYKYQSGNAPLSGVARALGSPILMENYVQGWSGALGMLALKIADAGLRAVGAVPNSVKPSWTVSDIPFVRAFVIRYPQADSGPIDQFYKSYDEQKQFYDSWSARAKQGDAASMAKIQLAGGPQIFMKMDSFARALSAQSKVIRDIYDNPRISSDEKRQLIDTLYYGMISTAKAANQLSDSINARLKDVR